MRQKHRTRKISGAVFSILSVRCRDDAGGGKQSQLLAAPVIIAETTAFVIPQIAGHRRPTVAGLLAESGREDLLKCIDVITAAVAVPLLEIDGENHVVFTVRSNTLRRQPGEISFPGGHCEPNDKSGAHAAMRECSEELGIDLDQIELLGNLDCLVSAIGVKLYAIAVRLHTVI